MNWLPRIEYRTWEPVLRAVFIVLIFAVLARFDRLASDAALYVTRAWHDGVDYQAIRMKDNLYASALEARRYIPPGAPWNVSRSQGLWPWNRAHYVMYPNTHVSKDWKFFIDMNGEITAPEPSWTKMLLSTGAVLYARDAAFLDPPLSPIPSYSNVPSLLTFFAVTLVQLVAGIALMARFRVPLGAAGGWWYLSSAYLIGFLVSNALTWLLLLAGVTFSAGTVAPVWVAMAIGACIAARMQLADAARALGKPAAWRTLVPETPWGWATLLAVALVTLFLLLPIVLVPVWSFDALGHWFYKSKALVFHGNMAFMGDSNHPEYPLIWTLQAAVLFLIAGGPYDEMMQWTNALMIVVILAQLHGALLFLRAGRSWTWTGLLLYLTFFVQASLSWSYADTPFLSYLAALLAALAAASGCVRDSRVYLGLAVAMATGLSLIKFEGFIAVAVVAGAFAAVQPGFPKSPRAWGLLFLLASPALLEMAWKEYVKQKGFGGSTHFEEPFSLARLQLLVTRVVNSVDGQGMGWRLFCGAALALLLRPGRRWTRFEVFLGLTGIPLVLFAVLGLMGWSTNDIDKYTLTATDRLVMHATPVLLLLFASVLAAPGEETAGALANTVAEPETIAP